MKRYEVNIHFNHWLPVVVSKIARKDIVGITLFGNIYFKSNPVEQPNFQRLLRHEFCHISQAFINGMFKFLLLYVWQWVRVGFKYTEIPFEKEARQGIMTIHVCAPMLEATVSRIASTITDNWSKAYLRVVYEDGQCWAAYTAK